MKKDIPSLRSALGRARGLGSAKAGTHHWWMQRVTALALILLWLYLIGGFFCHVVFGSYTDTIGWLHSPFSATAVILLLAAGFYHATLGLQVVIEDYIHCECMKTFSIIGVKFAAAAFTVLGIVSVAKILFGA